MTPSFLLGNNRDLGFKKIAHIDHNHGILKNFWKTVRRAAFLLGQDD